MIQEIHSFDEYEDFIGELAVHPLYSDPHFTYDKNNLYRSLKAKDKHAFAVLENGITEGLFVWVVLPDDRYIEMLIGCTKKEKAFTEMLAYMEKNYCGYQMDFVFNPHNTAISRPLKLNGAIFDPEQQKMILTGPMPNVSINHINCYQTSGRSSIAIFITLTHIGLLNVFFQLKIDSESFLP